MPFNEKVVSPSDAPGPHEEAGQSWPGVGRHAGDLVGTVTSCIGHLRRNIAERLEKELGVERGLDDVLARDEQGYFLREWILVHDGGALVGSGNGVRLQRKMLERHLRVTAKTAKRDFAELCKLRRIEFVRSPSPGYCRLKKAK